MSLKISVLYTINIAYLIPKNIVTNADDNAATIVIQSATLLFNRIASVTGADKVINIVTIV
jgi:hypothetical protein